ncbi:hypothetical protein RUND412_009287 [Rhizina undulata]
MTCHIVNNKKMLVLGDHHINSSETLNTCSWDEVNLFDMMSLIWLDQYTPQPNAVYEIPEVAKEAVRTTPENGWDDPSLAKIFFLELYVNCPAISRLEQALSVTAKQSKITTIISYGGGGSALILLCMIIFCVRRRKRENDELKVEL